MVDKKEDFDLVKKLNLVSVILVPLISGSKIFGVITLVSTDENDLFDTHDLKFAEEIGRRAGSAVDNAQLFYNAQREIRERKKIQNELQSSKEQLSAILENVADGITVLDDKGQVIFVNPAIARDSGYKSAEKMLKAPIAWKNDLEVMDESGKRLEINELPGRLAVFSKKTIEKKIKSVDKKTNAEKWAFVKAKPIIDSKGVVKGAVSITHDITAEKELERKKDDFISIASHELKTPITSIKGYIHLLKLLNNSDVNKKYLEKVEKQLSKLSELVEDLLEMSRLTSGKLSYKKESFNFSKLVKEVVADMQEVDHKHKIILQNGIREKIVADRERISQVLINLINNAVKYSPQSDKVLVKVSKYPDGVRVGIKDFGIGINMDEKDKVFDRFYRAESVAHKTFPGLGIGLFWSKEIIDRHKGKIWFKSQKGKGSTFYFQIPTGYE